MSHAIIFKPVLSEASLNDQKKSKYHFWVPLTATKTQIASAFFNVFSTRPLKITTHIVKGKIKTNWRQKQTYTQKSQKRAIVTIGADQKIKILAPKSK